jgi:hypothetical protein
MERRSSQSVEENGIDAASRGVAMHNFSLVAHRVAPFQSLNLTIRGASQDPAAAGPLPEIATGYPVAPIGKASGTANHYSSSHRYR